ncbi:hypothetical protein I3842_04G035900 [Carya illinoinensis]|uniref:glucan endo-1,3-beta-D-glucosidase n=1 Tax=Carya illinoinensis TaxID=32201 RepID=A0A922F8K2_CARIL|nr:hypothetical protein I3842_04G035900 [Carya illinoinensis]
MLDLLRQTGSYYGRIDNDLPTRSKLVQLMKSQGLTRVKLYDTNSKVLTALANSGISVTVALPNELLSSTATDQSYVDKSLIPCSSHRPPKFISSFGWVVQARAS